VTTTPEVHDVSQAKLHGEKIEVFADSGYLRVEMCEKAKDLNVN